MKQKKSLFEQQEQSVQFYLEEHIEETTARVELLKQQVTSLQTVNANVTA